MSYKGDKSVNKSMIETSGRFNVLNDELEGDAADSTGPANHAPPLPLALLQLTVHLKVATDNFEKIMEKAVKSMLDSSREVQKTLEFESHRITEFERKNLDPEKHLERLEKANQELEKRAASQDVEANLAERVAEKDNFPVVGLNEAENGKDEDCIKTVEDILSSKFRLKIKVESARRVGRK
ncbi:uncharacterized protein LOC135157729 [Lytechinus pictus]|uniref:uncharacterized protein LOC135157729 n=1 Tax=Lytechinus pictus TaxID=7653 RepID=UPI0030B9BFD8